MANPLKAFACKVLVPSSRGELPRYLLVDGRGVPHLIAGPGKADVAFSVERWELLMERTIREWPDVIPCVPVVVELDTRRDQWRVARSPAGLPECPEGLGQFDKPKRRQRVAT